VIYGTLVDMCADGKSIDLASLSEQLKIERKFNDVGGYAYLAQISGRIPTTAQAQFFIEKLMELYALRQLINKGQALVESAYNYSGDLKSSFSKHAHEIMTIASGSTIEPEASWDDLIEQALDVTESLITNKGRPPALVIDFPWKEMNELFQPMQRGQLVIPAGRTSTGKSCLLRQIAHHACVCGHKVYYDTLEVKPHQVPLQLAAMFSKIGIRQLHSAHKKDQNDFKSVLKDLRRLGIVVTNRERSFSQIVSRVKALHAAGRMDMFCVDYGGLIEEVSTARRQDLATEASRVMAGLKMLAVETNSVGVVPWQLNRDAEKDGNREPRLSDLRDCGQLENHGDKILLIHRPDENPLTKQHQKENSRVADMPRFFQNISQSKGRDDGVSLMSFYFNRPIAAFEEIQKDQPGDVQSEF
jgi:replicative DNA helicase